MGDWHVQSKLTEKVDERVAEVGGTPVGTTVEDSPLEKAIVLEVVTAEVCEVCGVCEV
jgi:hypothetical protein